MISAAETELERELSRIVMAKASRSSGGSSRKARRSSSRTSPGRLFLVLDGMLDVEIDGEVVAEVGPGAILGVHASVTGGMRSSTLRARRAAASS